MSTYAHRPVFSSKGARRYLRTLLALALLALVTVPATAQIVINEVDADTPGTDTLEFVELYDGGVGNTALDGLVVVLVNGSNDASYSAFDLDGQSTDGSGYFVLCGNAATVANCDLDVSPNTNLIQNGADAVALYSGDAADFPNGTALTTVDLIDAIVYDTSDSDDLGLLVLLNAGQPQVNEAGGGNKDGHSNQRCTNGSGGARNTDTYDQFPPTPGGANFCGSVASGVLINEVDADTPGSDSLEFVELFDGGVGSTALDGLVLVFYNGNGDASYRTISLNGFTTDGDGYFLAGNAAVSPALVFQNNGLQNGADAVALYVGDAASFPNGTALTTVDLIDAIVYDTSDSDDLGLLVLLNAGQPQVNEAGGGNKDGHSNQRCTNGSGGARNTDTYDQFPPTPGAENTCGAVLDEFEIFEIQGSALASPFDGAVVTTLENVVTTLATDGFFIQTPETRSDGDVDTSDGIFVFTGSAPTVSVGDLVDVTGEVNEFFGMTEFGFGSTVTVVSVGTVPAPVIFDASVPSPDPNAPSCSIEYECYEGMLVEIADGTVGGPNQRFSTDIIAEVHITAAPARTFREPGIEFPGVAPFPVWDGNPEVFELDPDKLGLPNQIIPAGSSFSAIGVLGFEFGGYELWPNQLTFVPAPLRFAVRPREPGEFTVGTLNLFRLNAAISKISAHIREVLRSPDILAVQEVQDFAELQAIADQITIDDSTVVYTASLLEGNDIGGIDVGFLTRQSIHVDTITQVDPDVTFVNPITLEDNILHDRPPLLLEGSCELEFGSFPIVVMAVHNRSLGGIDGSEGLRVRKKRFLQAVSIANKVDALQAADPGIRLVVAGDFNAFEFTDGFVDAVGVITGDFDPDDNLVCDTEDCTGLPDNVLLNEVLGLPAAERYSFIFRGNAQVLDHALTSVKLEAEITGAEFGRGNADAAVDLINDATTPGNIPLRSSDHDGLVVYILKDKDADGVPNDDDVCSGTVIPEGVPTHGLRTNRYALVDGDGIFDTKPPNGNGPGDVFTIGDTAGCSCEQIIIAQGLGNGHVRHGCSVAAMRNWGHLVNP